MGCLNLLGVFMSSKDRVQRHREKMAQNGLKVIEIALPHELLKMFEIEARFRGLSRSSFISTMISLQYNSEDYRSHIANIVHSTSQKRENNKYYDKHGKEFTNYTLS